MTDSIKNTLLMVCAVLLVITTYAFLISQNTLKNERASSARTANAYAALDTKIQKSVKDGIAAYSVPAPEISVDDIMNSPAFKKLTADQQKYYASLQADKRHLITSAQIKFTKHDTVYVTAPVKEALGSTDSTVVFKRNTVVAFQDTSKSLKWNASITLNNPLAYHLRYRYNPVIQTTFKRNKDKSTLVELTVDDPDLEVNTIHSIVIPLEQQQHPTLVGQLLYKNRRVLRAIGYGALFVGGAYVGHTL